jgi:hypothetical protein
VADDEKQAKAITPRAVQHFSWMHGDTSPAASKSADTLLGKSEQDEALKASGPTKMGELASLAAQMLGVQ